MNGTELFQSIRLPARLTVVQVAVLLGFLEYEIGILVHSGILKPLGRPAPNGHKYFSSLEIESLAKDREWLSKATLAVSRAIQQKNRNLPRACRLIA